MFHSIEKEFIDEALRDLVRARVNESMRLIRARGIDLPHFKITAYYGFLELMETVLALTNSRMPKEASSRP